MAILTVSASSFAASGDVRLVEAVKSGGSSAAIALIAKRVDVNAPEVDGTTALHWAVHRSDVDLVDRLIRAGADVKAKNQCRRHTTRRSRRCWRCRGHRKAAERGSRCQCGQP